MQTTRWSVVVALGLSMIVGLGGWNYHTSTPAYTLREARLALEHSNRLAFERRVDVSSLARSIVDDFFSFSIARGTDGAGENEVLRAAVGAAFLESMKPALVGSLERAIVGAVEAPAGTSSTFQFLGETRGVSDFAAELGLGAGMFQGIGPVRRDGRVALAELRFVDPLLDKTLVLSVRMDQRPSGWIITRVDDLGRYLQDVTRERERRIAAVNQDAQAEIAARVEIGPIRVQSAPSGVFEQTLELGVSIRNRGPDTLMSVELLVAPPKSWRPEHGSFPELSLVHRDTLAPNASIHLKKTVQLDPLNNGHAHLRTLSVFEAELESIRFVVEDSVRDMGVMHSWQEYVARHASGPRAQDN